MVKDLVHNLCESLVENIGGVSGATSRKVVVATPVITLTGNSVTITCDTTGATIYYTLDGSTPTSSSSQYSSAFTLDSSCTIKAIAIKGGKSSGIAEEEYVKPITYLTQWKIVGNSEVHGQEIWSCGEYNPIDGKWHILVQPQGGSIADIALTEPLRMTDGVDDTIEFPTEQEGKALVTRNLKEINMGEQNLIRIKSGVSGTYRFYFGRADAYEYSATDQYFNSINSAGYINVGGNDTYLHSKGIKIIGMYPASADVAFNTPVFMLYDPNYNQSDSLSGLLEYLSDKYMIYRLATPTTELVDAPQIEEADSYTCVITPGGKAVSWSEFLYTLNYLLTDSENNLLVDSENYQLTVQS